MQVDRYTKTRKSTYTSFELFSVRARDIPMEVVPCPLVYAMAMYAPFIIAAIYRLLYMLGLC